MQRIQMRYLQKAGPAYVGKIVTVSPAEARALECIGIAERFTREVTPSDHLSREITPSHTKEVKEVVASDSVRALAENRGIDLHSIAGTGQGGRILKKDIEAAQNTSTE